jgi:multiple sugar transport system permease protein
MATVAQQPSRTSRRRNVSGWERQQERAFYLMISPWIIGFLVFTFGPMVASAYYSFTEWDLLSTPQWVGLENYRVMLTDDPTFWSSLRVTLIYCFASVGLNIVAALVQ